MSTPDNHPPEEKLATDSDMLMQARPGHGIPSQDPDAAAQLPLSSKEMEKEAQSALVGGGLIAGAAVGAAIGVMVSGPVGVVVGAGVGAVAGAFGAASSTGDIKDPPQDPGR